MDFQTGEASHLYLEGTAGALTEVIRVTLCFYYLLNPLHHLLGKFVVMSKTRGSPSPLSQPLVLMLCMLLGMAYIPLAECAKAPYPKMNFSMHDLPIFMAAFWSYLNTQNPARPLAQGIADVLSNLSDMDPRVANAWINFSTTETAAGRNPFNIDANDFQLLISNSIRNPLDMSNTVEAFNNMKCTTVQGIPAFTQKFRQNLSQHTMLGQPYPDGVILVTNFILKLPTTIRGFLLAANYTNINDAMNAAANHATATVDTTVAMDLGFLEDAQAAGVDPTTAVELAAIVHQRYTPNKPNRSASNGPAAAGTKSYVRPEERQRRIDGGLCLYCGQHANGTFCQADADKKARFAARTGKPGNV